jgi:beta-mannosidase
MGSRFVSEFGMEAYPHLSTITSAITDPKQQYPGSMFMDYHNRAGDHERRLLTYSENFRIKYDLPSFTHLTQMIQANAMDNAYHSWRRDWGKPGSRKTGGVLVWQLNDCWPTMSWAIVDCNLVKKPSFYAIKRALKPIVVGVSRAFHEWTGGHTDPTIAARDTKYDVWVASSSTDSVEGEITVRFVSVKTGKEVAASVKKSVKVQKNSTTDVIQQGTVDVKVNSDNTVPFDHDNYDPCVICTSLSINGETVSTQTAWPHPIKYLDFIHRGVKVDILEAKDKIIVSAEKPVHGFVFQEKRDWLKFADNGFDIIPGEDKVVEISGANLENKDLRWTYIGADPC